MSRLIHLNGPPGIGKSTLARLYVDRHPGTFNCDIDVLRTLVGGWRRDFGAAGALIRPAALALISAYLAQGQEVVLPQLLGNLPELERFESAARDVGADFVSCLLADDEASAIARFHRRGDSASESAWHDEVRRIVEAEGGDRALADHHRRLHDLLTLRPGIVVIPSTEGEVEATYRALLAAISPGGQDRRRSGPRVPSRAAWPRPCGG